MTADLNENLSNRLINATTLWLPSNGLAARGPLNVRVEGIDAGRGGREGCKDAGCKGLGTSVIVKEDGD